MGNIQQARQDEYTLPPRPQARHLPGHIYTSPEIFEREKRQIFLKDWLCVGRVEELEKPGDYFALRIADEPVVVCRDQTGQLNAFSNVCAHRGTEVASGSGNKQSFSCPYHGWTYDLTGKLLNAPYVEDVEGFQPAICRLPAVKLDTWDGYLFINFDAECESLASFLGDAPQVYEAYQCDKLRLAAKFSFTLDCNWKLMCENLVDIYHIAVLHAATFGPHQPLETYKFTLTEGGYHGRFKGGTLTPDGKSLFGPMPWLPTELHSGGYSSHIRPNMAFFPRFDFFSFITSWPVDGPEKSQGMVYLLFPAEHFTQQDFQKKVQVYEEFIHTVLGEDVSMVQSLQRGFKSQAYRPGPFSRYEAAVHNMITYNMKRIGFENEPVN